jgi:hypothetical protein
MARRRKKNSQDLTILLALTGIVVLVGFVGMLTLGVTNSSNGITGNVVAKSDSCSVCSGDTVCAEKDGRVKEYLSACRAECEGARVIFYSSCDDIVQQRAEV